MVLLGEKLERPTYTILHTMREGNTGVCHMAVHEVYGREVVQKTISLLGVADAAAGSEPALLNRLRHRHLVEVWEAQWDPDKKLKLVKAITFVMPYYPGETVYRALAEGYQFSIGQAVKIACGVLDALHYLHVGENLLHRDVKPANVMLDVDRVHPYLGDLGSAAFLSDDGDADAHAGTLLYRPPEAHTGRVGVTGDIYGVGMVLLEMLNGPLPYADIVDDKLRERLESGRAPVAAHLLKPGPHVPGALSLLVRQMIDRDPGRRPQSASDAMRRLQDVTHMDWRSNPEGTTWQGRWPPAAGARGRIFKIEREKIDRGRYAGLIKLTAAWRRPGALEWRGLASLTRRVPDEAAALRSFFRDVQEAAVQMAAA